MRRIDIQIQTDKQTQREATETATYIQAENTGNTYTLKHTNIQKNIHTDKQTYRADCLIYIYTYIHTETHTYQRTYKCRDKYTQPDTI